MACSILSEKLRPCLRQNIAQHPEQSHSNMVLLQHKLGRGIAKESGDLKNYDLLRTCQVSEFCAVILEYIGLQV